MTAPVTTTRATTKPAEIPAPDAVLAIAILVAGSVAAYLVMPMLWIVTPIMAVLVCYAGYQSVPASLALVTDDDAEFPAELRLSIDSAIDQLRPGEARQLMADVVRQARPLFAMRESAFDDTMERETRADVAELVTAVCETALELSRLDGAAPVRGGDELSERYRRARENLVTRLREAATALSEMYASGVEHGTPASDRIAELAAEVRADARARQAAIDELSS